MNASDRGYFSYDLTNLPFCIAGAPGFGADEKRAAIASYSARVVRSNVRHDALLPDGSTACEVGYLKLLDLHARGSGGAGLPSLAAITEELLQLSSARLGVDLGAREEIRALLARIVASKMLTHNATRKQLEKQITPTIKEFFLHLCSHGVRAKPKGYTAMVETIRRDMVRFVEGYTASAGAAGAGAGDASAAFARR